MYKSLVELSAENALSRYNAKIGYYHYDFHEECHKNTDPLEAFVEEELAKDWIEPFGLYKETRYVGSDEISVRNEINSL